MSKRKPATASKNARSPKIVAKAQRSNQAVVRSPRDSRLRPVASNESPKPHSASKQKAPLENPATSLPEDFKQTMRDNGSKKGFDFSSASANVRAYQAKLLEMAQANMQFALEFTQRLAAIRSPVELLRVIEELTSKRIAMFQKYSKEMVELGPVDKRDSQISVSMIQDCLSRGGRIGARRSEQCGMGDNFPFATA